MKIPKTFRSKMAKITIIGAGNVGSQVAFCTALKNLGDVVLLDITDGLAKGKALDILSSMPIAKRDIKIIGTESYDDTKDSDIVIITAGVVRKPGMSRDNLIKTNAKIMSSIIPQILEHSPNSILIIVSNPLDAMVQLAYKLSGFPKERVMGMAGVLDSSRFRTFIAEELNVSVKDIETWVLGGHGDLMVPLIHHSKVKDQALSKIMDEEKLNEVIKRVQNGGSEIVQLLKTGSAFFAPGIATVDMIESILKDEKRILPSTVLLEGEYGVNGLFVGAPARLGRKGVEEVIEFELTDKEKEMFQKSVEHIKSLIEKI
ncbi:MAG: malate dehydrogenase [Nanoarchaeota archaeon]|nr:malate dehydrogenase [Nanoarchaeota archaeon]